MSILAEEYNTLQDRQEAIKQDMLGVAAALAKLDNSLGKRIASEITSKAVQSSWCTYQNTYSIRLFFIWFIGLNPNNY